MKLLFKEQKQEKPTVLQNRMKESQKEALRNRAEKYNMTISDFVKNACNLYANELEKSYDNKLEKNEK